MNGVLSSFMTLLKKVILAKKPAFSSRVTNMELGFFSDS